MMFDIGKGGENPAPAPKDNRSTIPAQDTETPNYLGAEPASTFGSKFETPRQYGPTDLTLSPPPETPVKDMGTVDEPLIEPKKYLGAPGFGDKPERPADDYDVLKEKSEAERKAKIEAIRQKLLELLQSGQDDVTIETNLTVGDGKNIIITLENIKSIS